MNKIKTCLLLLLFSTIYTNCLAQNKLEWLSFESAEKKNLIQPKKTFIFLHTDWCIWCKKMNLFVFNTHAIQQQLNNNYYSVKINGEEKKTIQFRNESYAFLPQYKVNEITLAFLGNRLSYPAIIILDEKYNLIFKQEGYLNKKQLEKVLTYFSTNTISSK